MSNLDFLTGEKPNIAQWLQEAKEERLADKCGMYLIHNGVVRATSQAQVREGKEDQPRIQSVSFTYMTERVLAAISKTKKMLGIFCVRVWLNCGQLKVGDDMMLVLVGGDIRPHVTRALEFLVGELKEHCVTETENS